ncbi:MAG TPA: hypothetical protein DEP42_02500 [Ruminococcaceae bacterium]|nr:hypothetical protein [Oscillospiraceae bacterium]
MKNMVLESWVIIIIMGIASYMSARAHRNRLALRILPLVIAPLANIMYSPVSRHLAASTVNQWRIIAYVIALIITAAWVWFYARKMEPKNVRWVYVICALAFTAIELFIFACKLIH